MTNASKKTLVVGDMHLKEELILSRVDAAIERLAIERVVFCGDYVDEWHASDLMMREALVALTTWVASKRSQGLEVDLVLGNHDMCYLLNHNGPGTHSKLYAEVSAALSTLNVSVATVVGSCLVTHAGVTASWAQRYLSPEDCASASSLAHALNVMLEHEGEDGAYALYSAGPARGGNSLPSPLWADLTELYQDPIPNVFQIVGHTPVESIDVWQVPCEDGEHTAARLIFCDTFSLTSYLTPIGDGSMLVVDGASIFAATSEGLGAASWGEESWKWAMSTLPPIL